MQSCISRIKIIILPLFLQLEVLESLINKRAALMPSATILSRIIESTFFPKSWFCCKNTQSDAEFFALVAVTRKKPRHTTCILGQLPLGNFYYEKEKGSTIDQAQITSPFPTQWRREVFSPSAGEKYASPFPIKRIINVGVAILCSNTARILSLSVKNSRSF